MLKARMGKEILLRVENEVGVLDQIARTVWWRGGSDGSALAGKPIRLRFVMRDADLFSIQFVD